MSLACLLIEDDIEVQDLIKSELSKAGFSVIVAPSAQALSNLNLEKVDIVLLDLWLPDCDGLSLIPQLKYKFQCPVIILSAQGDPDTIVKAIRLGAENYFEKPVNMIKLLSTISELGVRDKKNNQVKGFKFSRLKVKNGVQVKPFPRKSLKQGVMFFGLGIHSGRTYGLQIEPGVDGTYFQPFGTDFLFPISGAQVYPAGLSSGIRFGDYEIRTVEHLLSALWGTGLTDCIIKTGSEIPILDGSSANFVKAFKKAGFKNLGFCHEIVVDKEFELNFDGKSFKVFPSPCLKITYNLELGGKTISASFSQEQDYELEIAPARTFAELKDVELAHNKNLAQGGRLNNFVLFNESEPINAVLRFENEPARHKILDLIGDLYSLGFRWQVGIVAHKTGHAENLQLLEKLKSLYLESE